MERVDEMTNDELARHGHSEANLRYELERVERVVKNHIMSGEDLTYWHERARILRSLLHSGTRAA